MKQKDYIELISTKPCLLDTIYKTKSSNSDDWLENYSLCDSYLKKYLYYRFNASDGIDIDSCEYAMPVYVALSSNIFTESTFEKQYKSGSSSKYEIEINNQGFLSYLRGDTGINAMSAIIQLFEFVTNKKVYKPSEKNSSDESFRKQYKELVAFLENSTEYREIYTLLNEHIKLCYSIGNFYPLIHIYRQYGLNNNKAHYCLNGYISAFDDVMSEWLKEMKYCLEGTDSAIKENYRNHLNSTYAFWINEYKDKGGWDYFVQENCFEPFLKDGEPIVFWNVTQNRFKDGFINYLKGINSALKDKTWYWKKYVKLVTYPVSA